TSFAIVSFVPTPSVAATRMGSLYDENDGLKNPENPPTFPSTPFLCVLFMRGPCEAQGAEAMTPKILIMEANRNLGVAVDR
ncbi:MAG: hypothetical protein V3S51_08260, partial [Dehalococcoidia bacterium]